MKNMMKSFKNKIALFLSALLMLQFVMLNGNDVQAALNTSISYSITGNTTVGSTIEISINASNVTDLYGGSIDFLYDPTLLQIQSITKGNIFGSKSVLTPLGENGQISNGKASFAITLKGNTAGVNVTSGTLAVIKAKVLKAGTVKLNTTSDNSNLDLKGNTIRVKLSNANANSISYTATNESISLTEDVVSPTVTLKAGTYQEDNAAFAYNGVWKNVYSSNYDNGALKQSETANSYVEFKFDGTSFEWYGTKAVNRGIAKVYVDGKEVKSVDCYSATAAHKQLLYKSETLIPGTHTVKILVTGTKNSAANNCQIDLDKIIIKNDVVSPTVTLKAGTYQENNAAFAYNGVWKNISSSNYDGGALMQSETANSYVEFKFDGTSFEWYGTKAVNRGIAKVYVDGKEVKLVDAYSATTAHKQLLYKSETLTAGTHTVKILVTGAKNSAANNCQVDLDKIVIKNESAAPTATLEAGTYQEDNSAFVYGGTWKEVSSNNYDDGALMQSETANSYVEFKFNGTSFEWYGTKAAYRGIAKVYIDGNEVKTIDTYDATTAFKTLIYKSDKLAAGTHTVKIVVTGTKNSAAKAAQIDFDKIVINNEATAPTATLEAGTYQEDNSAFVYGGTWKEVSSNNYDDGALMQSETANSYVEFKFNGTSFEWYGTKAAYRGIAKVYIDGNEVKTIDTYDATTAFKTLIYKSDKLAAGTHTVKIVVTGTKNSAAKAAQVDFDKIVIKNESKASAALINNISNDIIEENTNYEDTESTELIEATEPTDSTDSIIDIDSTIEENKDPNCDTEAPEVITDSVENTDNNSDDSNSISETDITNNNIEVIENTNDILDTEDILN